MEKPLTSLQQAYLLGRSDQWPLGGVAMHDFREYQGYIDLQQLARRLDELVSCHQALRTVIDSDALCQRVIPAMTANVDSIDLRHLSPADAGREIDRLRAHYRQICHDPASPPWRIVHITPPGDAPQRVLTSFDALILDGQGISAIIARLFDNQPLQPVSASATTDTPEHSARRREDQQYWQQVLADAVVPPRLPWRQSLGGIRQPIWRRETRRLEASQLKQVTRAGSARRLFANTVLSAVVLETLALWSEDQALTVGIPVAFPAADGELSNRSSFIAVNYARREGTPGERAERLQDDILNGVQHLSAAGVDLARQLSPGDNSSPALPVILTSCMSWETLPADAAVRFVDGLTQTPQVALDIRLMLDEQRNLLLAADYAEQALAPEQVCALMDAIVRHLQQVAASGELDNPVCAWMDYPATPAGAAIEWDFLTAIARNLFDEPPPGAALICGAEQLSWPELGARVARAINGLRQRGLGAGSVVALYLPRSPEHVVLSLACALAGMIRVPIDINSPPERTRYLRDNCRPQLVVSRENSGLDDTVTPEALLSDSAQKPELAPDSRSEQPAYYLYTSGTTGKPKCVVLHNRATANVLAQTVERWQVTGEDVFISVTPLHHDMSVFDLFASMAVGATLVLPAEHEEKDALGWSRLVEQHRVSLWCSVPAILDMLLDCATPLQLASLRLVAQGGDYIKPHTIRTLRQQHPRLRLVSLGGPTETTIWSIWHDITPKDDEVIPYGQPLAGNRYFLCHENGDRVPCGVVGRIHTAGVNLAAGYLEDGQLVQHDFVTLTTPEGEPVRAFRTGDMGFARPDGTIIFATRINGYVKIRGVRVSLPEIEAVFRQHPAIDDIVVVDYAADGGTEKSLGAFWLTASGTSLSMAELRAFAMRYLPCTHIPGRFVQKTQLPLSANGKVDRHSLRAELVTRHQAKETPSVSACARVAPQPGQVIGIYCEVIGKTPRPEWDARVPFIAMGLKLSHLRTVTARINAAFGVTLADSALLRCKNAADVCALLP